MKKAVIGILIASFLYLDFQPAYAHAQIDLSVPKRNQVIAHLPRLVWIEFDGNLITIGDKDINRLFVTNSKNQRVDAGGTIVGGARISTKLKSGLIAGKYKVSYRVVSEDGHPVEGSFSFTYKP